MTTKSEQWKTGQIHNFDRAGQRPGPKCAPTPDSVFLNRDARSVANMRRSATQEQFGDPPPGFTALDEWRRRQKIS